MRYPFEAAVPALAAVNFLPEGDSLGKLALVGYPVFYILFVCKRYPFNGMKKMYDGTEELFEGLRKNSSAAKIIATMNGKVLFTKESQPY